MQEYKIELMVYNKDYLDKFDENESVNINFVPIKEITYKHDTAFGAYSCEILDDFDEKEIKIIEITGNFIRPLDLGQSYIATGLISIYRGKKQFKLETVKKVMPTNERGIIFFLRSLNMGHMADILSDEYGLQALEIIRNNPMELLSKWPALYEEQVLGWQSKLEELKDDYEYMVKLMNYGIKAAQAKELYDKYNETIFQKINDNPYFLANEISGYSFKKCDSIAKTIGTHPENQQRLCEGSIHVLNILDINGNTYFEYDKFINEIKNELNIKISIMEIKKIYKSLSGTSPYLYKYGKMSLPIEQMVIFNAIELYKKAKTKRQKEEAKITIFEVDEKKIKEALNILLLEERIVIENNRVYKKNFYDWEMQIAYHIKRIIDGDVPVASPTPLEAVIGDSGIQLEDKQKEAVEVASSSYGGIVIIDGSAGCGKTFCVKIALKLIEENFINKKSFFEKVILAPTGKASKVAQKATGIPSFTIHKALNYNPQTNGFYFNSKNPLPYDCIVIDECSMLDTELANNLFSAINPNCKVILMGDTKQLPSIGAGNVFKDMIDSGKIKNVTLNVIKRQGIDSGIVKNARNIVDGMPMTTQKELMDALVYKGNDDSDSAQKMFTVIEKLLAKYKLPEIQVLTPQKTGGTGTNYLNFILQEKFNPNNNEVKILNRSSKVEVDEEGIQYDLFFKKGDKVINVRNNYSIPWYKKVDGKLTIDPEKSGVTNGETGTIVKMINLETKKMIIVKYEDKYIAYENDFSDLEHAYALTIHKSQGSEWPCVVLMLMTTNYLMLDRNLLYTGYTRAKQFNATITTPHIMETCLKTQNSLNRNTGLKDRIIEYIA